MRLPAFLRPWVERLRLRSPAVQRGILMGALAVGGGIAAARSGPPWMSTWWVDMVLALFGLIVSFGFVLLLAGLAGLRDRPHWCKPSMDAPLGNVLRLRGVFWAPTDLPLLFHTFGLLAISASVGIAIGPLIWHGVLALDFVMHLSMGIGSYCGSLLCPRLYPQRYWREQDCQNCGYDLTGNESGTCPECGAAIPPAQRTVLRRPPADRDA